ncbi:MAG: hypothetical protein ACXWLY_31340 [Thermoanaerobaculia bacterium]
MTSHRIANAELARLSGVSRQTTIDYRYGRRHETTATLAKFAQGMSLKLRRPVKVEEFFDVASIIDVRRKAS